MKSRTRLIVAQSLLGILATTLAAAAPLEQEKLVQRITDPATGLEVRVLVSGASDFTVEVGDPTVSIRKRLVRDTSVTEVTTRSENLIITSDMSRLRISGSNGRIDALRTRPEDLDAVRRLLGRSEAVGRAITLLGRLNLGPESPVGHTLLVARAFLLTATGRSDGAAELARWTRAAGQALKVVPVARKSGPEDCWNEYVREAISAYMELEDCLKNLKWYDVFGEFSCDAIYDLRALGAFSWWIHCVSLRG
jgi:hypothetical protein